MPPPPPSGIGRRSSPSPCSSDTLTPVAAALRLRDRLAFILERVEGGARYGRYSIVGVRGRMLTVDGDEAVVRDAEYVELERFAAHDPLEALRRVLPPRVDDPRVPFPLASGVGYLAYEAAARWEKAARPGARRDRAAAGACSTSPTWSSCSTTWPRPPRSRPSIGTTRTARLAAVADRLAHPVRRRGPHPAGGAR